MNQTPKTISTWFILAWMGLCAAAFYTKKDFPMFMGTWVVIVLFCTFFLRKT